MSAAADILGLYPRLPYLPLLNVRAVYTAAALRACAAAEREADADAAIAAAFGQVNWRPHLLACGMLIARRQRAPIAPPLLAALWARVDDWSWSVPQLCATAALIDPAFEARADARIERLHAAGPEGGPSAKAMQALLALTGRAVEDAGPQHAAWFAEGALPIERAVRWRARMQAVLDGPWQVADEAPA